jgi:hypothetical protein
VVDIKSSERTSLYLAKIRRITIVNTQAIRAKLFRGLDELSELVDFREKGSLPRQQIIVADFLVKISVAEIT